MVLSRRVISSTAGHQHLVINWRTRWKTHWYHSGRLILKHNRHVAVAFGTLILDKRQLCGLAAALMPFNL